MQGSSSSTPGAPLTTYITGDTLVKIGNYNPRELVGLTNTFTYHRFSFRFLVDGRIGGTMVSGTEMNPPSSGITKNTLSFREGGLTLFGVDVNGNAVPTAITAQSFWQTASGQRYGVGQFFAYNGYQLLRLREVSLGYDIPLKNTTIIKSLKFSARRPQPLLALSRQIDAIIPGIGTSQNVVRSGCRQRQWRLPGCGIRRYPLDPYLGLQIPERNFFNLKSENELRI